MQEEGTPWKPARKPTLLPQRQRTLGDRSHTRTPTFDGRSSPGPFGHAVSTHEPAAGSRAASRKVVSRRRIVSEAQTSPSPSLKRATATASVFGTVPARAVARKPGKGYTSANGVKHLAARRGFRGSYFGAGSAVISPHTCIRHGHARACTHTCDACERRWRRPTLLFVRARLHLDRRTTRLMPKPRSHRGPHRPIRARWM